MFFAASRRNYPLPPTASQEEGPAEDRQFHPAPSPGHQASRLPPGNHCGFPWPDGQRSHRFLTGNNLGCADFEGAGVRAEYTAPVLVVEESVSLKPVAGASSVNSRLPRPTATGKTSSRYSSIKAGPGTWHHGRVGVMFDYFSAASDEAAASAIDLLGGPGVPPAGPSRLGLAEVHQTRAP